MAAILLSAVTLRAQQTIQLHNLWAKPQVHVLFNGYIISFKIKDINRALELLAETGDTTYGRTSGLDTAREYHTELLSGLRMEYKTPLQPLLQRGVGVFLLMAGQAEVRNPRGKKLKEIVADIEPVKRDDEAAYIRFADPRNNYLLFSGSMATEMYKKDIGID